jgi:hypothetical protein
VTCHGQSTQTPAPPETDAAPGRFMWFYWRLVPIARVARYAKDQMGNFDRLPRRQRDKLNYERGGTAHNAKRARN